MKDEAGTALFMTVALLVLSALLLSAAGALMGVILELIGGFAVSGGGDGALGARRAPEGGWDPPGQTLLLLSAAST